MATNKNNPLRETLILGLGLMDLTREKVEKLVSEATKGISKQDKKKAVDHLFKYAAGTKKNAKNMVVKQIKSVLDDLDLVVKRKNPTSKRGSRKKRA